MAEKYRIWQRSTDYDRSRGWQDSSTERDQVMRGEADMAAADLTITAAREEVLDFTHPFMYIGLGVLYTKNTRSTSLLY